MTTRPTVPHDVFYRPGFYILPDWLTPGFAQYWLARGGLAQHPRAHERFSQQWRYECFAQGIEPDRARDWTLAWREKA